jgi:hypothetical protein
MAKPARILIKTHEGWTRSATAEVAFDAAIVDEIRGRIRTISGQFGASYRMIAPPRRRRTQTWRYTGAFSSSVRNDKIIDVCGVSVGFSSEASSDD